MYSILKSFFWSSNLTYINLFWRNEQKFRQRFIGQYTYQRVIYHSNTGKIKWSIVREWLHKSSLCWNVSMRNNVYRRLNSIENYVWLKWKSSNDFCTLLCEVKLIPKSWCFLPSRECCTSSLSFLPHMFCTLKGITWQMGGFEHSAFPLFFYFHIFLAQRTDILDFPVCKSFTRATPKIGRPTNIQYCLCG